MILRELFKKTKIALAEGGNLELPNPQDPTQPHQAQEIHLSSTNIKDDILDRTYMVGVLKQLLADINKAFSAQFKQPLWDQKLLDTNIKEFMAGSSEHFFDLERPNPNFNPKQPPSELNPKMVGISDDEFKKYKPKVGDIDIQCNQELQPQLAEFLTNITNVKIGNATFLGFSKGNEQYNGLFQFNNPPIKLQLDFEYGRYAPETGKPAEWTKFSHSSSWEDIQQNIKGVFHKYIYRSLAKAVPTEKYVAKLTGLGKNRAIALFGGAEAKEQFIDVKNPPAPFIDANFSFAVASKGGGGIRAKYKPYIDPETNSPKIINGIPVMEPLKPEDSEYIQDLNKQFQLFFGQPPIGDDRKLQNSFVGTLELMNKYLDDQAKRTTTADFLTLVFEPGAQMITKGDPARDYDIKFAAVDKMLATLGLTDMKPEADAMAQSYIKDFHDVEAFKQANPNEKQPRAAMLKQRNATPVTEAEDQNTQVKAQLRKGMPHLHDLKPIDLLDLIDEIHDGNGRFKLENIPLNVKVDGFGGRFGKNADGKPFMGTSRTEPRYQAGFVKYHQEKGTTDPEVLGRAQLFDQLFAEMMKAIKLVDSNLGPEFLVNKQVTCEVLYLPFATETPEGKLKFVGIHYDKLPEGVQLALVPFRVVDATTGEDLSDSIDFTKQLLSVGQAGSVMFIDNSLTQKEGLDVTALVPPLENIEQLKAMLADKSPGSLQRKRDIAASLEPVKAALEKAIIEDPNIIGKDILGKDYEGIVINSRLGPIKVTSQEQRGVISSKNAAKAQVKSSQKAAGNIPKTENKTAVVAIGSFVGHIGHEQLFDYTVKKAAEVGGDPYLFIGNAVGKDDPIPVNVKVQTWHKLYPEYASHISAVTEAGGTIMQKIKHELIQPMPGGTPRYDNIIIMVGEDQAAMPIATALMKSVNKFKGYEHVKVSLEVTPRGTGMSFSKLRNILKDANATEQQQIAMWSQAFDVNKLGIAWVKHLMELTRNGMGLQKSQATGPIAERLSTALIRPQRATIAEATGDERFDSALAKIIQGATPNTPKRFIKNIKKVAKIKYKFQVGDWVTIDPNETAKWPTSGMVGRISRFSSDGAAVVNVNPGGGASGGGSSGTHTSVPTSMLEKLAVNLDEPGVTEGSHSESDEELENFLDITKPELDRLYKLAKTSKKAKEEYYKLKEKWDAANSKLYGLDEQGVAESTSLPTTLKAIINDISEPIASVYDTMQFQAKKYFEGHGEINRGFNMVAAGVGGRWVQNLYFRKLQNELYDLCKYNPKRTVELQQFLRGYEDDKGELEMSRSFKNISNDLPKILIKIGNYLESPQLSKAAHRWIEKRDAYYAYLDTLVDDDDDYDEPEKIKPEKSRVVGQQNAQVDQIVNGVLAKLPKNVAGDIRNAIARSANKLQALHQELQKRNIQGVAEYTQLGELSKDTLRSYVPKRLNKAKDEISTDPDKRNIEKARRATKQDVPRAMTKLKDPEYGRQGVAEGAALPPEVIELIKKIAQSAATPEHKKATIDALVAKHSKQGVAERMMPASNFAGSQKNKLGPAGQWKNTGPSKNRPARAGDLVGGDAQESVGKKKGADGKACWDGYRYNGTTHGKDKCVKVSESVENIMDTLINKIITNEAVQNYRK